MAAPFFISLKRLRAALDPRSIERRGASPDKVIVNCSDLEQLLRDYDRLDANFRAVHDSMFAEREQRKLLEAQLAQLEPARAPDSIKETPKPRKYSLADMGRLTK